jgi:DNA-binding response OmpR family regulator
MRVRERHEDDSRLGRGDRVRVIGRRATGTDRPIVPTAKLGEIEIDIVNRQVRAGDSVVHLSGIEPIHPHVFRMRVGTTVPREASRSADHAWRAVGSADDGLS